MTAKSYESEVPFEEIDTQRIYLAIVGGGRPNQYTGMHLQYSGKNNVTILKELDLSSEVRKAQM